MALNVPLLRDSFQLVVERQPELTASFYDTLFGKYPAARELFGRNSRKQQEAMLRDALVAVIDHLEDAPWLQRELGSLGDKHVQYGVTPEMYAWVGDALLTTLAEVAGEQWNHELAEAWSDAYAAIVGLMLRR